MKYIKVKTAAEVKLAGIKVELEVTDKFVTALILRDKEGGYVKIERASSYESLPILVPAPPETEKKYVVRGTDSLFGKFEKVFDDKFEARDFVRELTTRDAAEFTEGEEDVVVADTTSTASHTSDTPF